MRYMLLVYGEEQAWTDAERAACYVESSALANTLQDEGKFLATAPLAGCNRHKRSDPRRQTPGYRRPFRRNPRAVGWLLSD